MIFKGHYYLKGTYTDNVHRTVARRFPYSHVSDENISSETPLTKTDPGAI